MTLQTALHRLLEDPTREMQRRGYPGDENLVLVIRADVNNPAPSQDDLRWSSVLYVKGTKKEARLTVRDYLATDWTVRKAKMREFDSFVFMGAGEHSLADSYRLHKILDNALSNLSTLQQGGGRGWIEDEELIQRDIEDAAKDICAALLGRKVTFGNKLPYPGRIRR